MNALDLRMPWRFRGMPFPIWLHSVRHASLLLLGMRAEAAFADLFLSVVAIGDLRRMWDVGAHIGWYSWIFLSRVADGEAVLFEPDPGNLDLLHRTARYLGARATILPLAASDRSGSAGFTLDPLTGATGSLLVDETFLERHFGRKEGLVNVKTVSLDDLLKPLAAPDLIKIDVEGAERLVLSGASALLRGQPVVIYETTSANRDHIARMFADLGYTLFDAEGYGRREQQSPNVLAWPARLRDRTERLLHLWRSRPCLAE